MSKEKEKNNITAGTPGASVPAKSAGKSVYAKKHQERRAKRGSKTERIPDEFEQRIIDLARVTRVMAGGKRMRFRACVAIGNRKGKVGLGLDKGADVTIAVNKAVNQAKKNMVDVSIVNETIPHEIYHKFGAAKIIIKPARRGKGVIAGGAIRIIMELAGVHNVTSKNLGTNNKVNVAKCTIAALAALRKVEAKPAKNSRAQAEAAGTAGKKGKQAAPASDKKTAGSPPVVSGAKGQ